MNHAQEIDREHAKQMAVWYAEELDKAADILQKSSPLGKVRGIGRMAVVPAIESIVDENRRLREVAFSPLLSELLGEIEDGGESPFAMRLWSISKLFYEFRDEMVAGLYPQDDTEDPTAEEADSIGPVPGQQPDMSWFFEGIWLGKGATK
jgi:hypothetical protein